jgi:hypothetical protein
MRGEGPHSVRRLFFTVPAPRKLRDGESEVPTLALVSHSKTGQFMIAMYRFVLPGLMLFASSAYAADAGNNYRFWGAGGVTCKDYGDMAKTQNADFDKVALWVSGYLTAYNRLSEKTYDIVGKNGNVSSIMLWLVSYCNKNADQTLTAAMNALTDDHQKDRVTTAPQ